MFNVPRAAKTSTYQLDQVIPGRGYRSGNIPTSQHEADIITRLKWGPFLNLDPAFILFRSGVSFVVSSPE